MPRPDYAVALWRHGSKQQRGPYELHTTVCGLYVVIGSVVAASCLVVGAASFFLYQRWEVQQARKGEEIERNAREQKTIGDRLSV
jgi:hypothetical protein